MTENSTNIRTEKVYVLYGSQTGNSEQACKDVCAAIKTRIAPSLLSNNAVKIEPVHMQLDDFLEIEKCPWTRLMIIVTSSYGVGQAPLGCYRFRDLCDTWTERCASDKKNNNNKVLDGMQFAMCGLGDSKYTTFFQNPTKIHDALQLVGATRVGPLGKADASGKGNDEQPKVIARWVDTIVPYLEKVVTQPPLPAEQLAAMQQHTIQICRQINPDFVMPSSSSATPSPRMMLLAILVAIVAIAGAYYWLPQEEVTAAQE